MKQQLVNNFSLLSKPIEKPDDGTVICQHNEFKFNRSFLIKISAVFKAILQNPCTQETQTSCFEITDVSPDTIQSFRNVLYHDYIDEKDLTAELLLMADKYDIKPLYKLCEEHLGESVTKEIF